MELAVVYTEKKLVKPSSPTPDHLRVYNLSSFDRHVNFLYAPHIYFYPGSTTEDDPVVETEKRIKLLEKSLSETLCFYYPLAGRLSNPDIVTVDCDDQGVLFIVQKVKTEMKDFLKKIESDHGLMDHMLTSMDVEGDVVDAPFIKIKISVFECGGLVVGMNILQVLGDGVSFTKFMNDWAKLLKQSTPICVTFDGARVFPLDSKTSSLLKKDVPIPGPSAGFVITNKIVAKTILFDSSTVAKLKDRVLASGRWTFQRPPSKVQIVTAVIWNGLIRAAKEKHGRERPFMTSISANLRGTLDTSNLSDNSFGNLYIPVPLKFIPGESKTEVHDLVYMIRDSLGKTVSECSKASNEDVFAMIIKAYDEMQEWATNKDEVDAVFATSVCRFSRYDVDFGWGRPCLVTLPTLRYPVFVLMDMESDGGAGVEVLFNHYEHEIQSNIAHIIDGMHDYLGKKN